VDMQKTFEMASHISNPLFLAGFFAAAFFYTVRQIVSRNIFPKLTAQLSSDVLKLIIVCLFVLSLVAMLLGFCGFVLVQFRPQSPSVKAGSVSVQGVIIRAGDGGQATGGNATIKAGDGLNGKSGGDVNIGPGVYTAGSGGSNGRGGDLIIKAGDAK